MRYSDTFLKEYERLFDHTSTILEAATEYWFCEDELIEAVLACSACVLSSQSTWGGDKATQTRTRIHTLVEHLLEFLKNNEEEIRTIDSTLDTNPQYRYVAPDAINTITKALPTLELFLGGGVTNLRDTLIGLSPSRTRATLSNSSS